MTTTTESVPDPLRTVARGAARLMGVGSAGTSGKGSMAYDYRRALREHKQALLQLMRSVIESDAPRLTLREADASVYKSKPPKGALLVVVCDASRPNRPVTVLRSSDFLYALYAGRRVTDRIVVQRVQAKGGV